MLAVGRQRNLLPLYFFTVAALKGREGHRDFKGRQKGICQVPVTRGMFPSMASTRCLGTRVEGQALSSILTTAKMRIRPRKHRVKTNKTCHCLCFPKQLFELDPAVEDP